jgi:LacI family transcriptional regulator
MARKRVALVLELDWLGRRHIDVLAGVHRWVDEHSDWEIRLDDTLAEKPVGRIDRYDGVIGRVTPVLAAAARKHRVPIVNVWRGSPAAGGMAGVFPDGASVGHTAAEFLLLRGFTSFACAYPEDRPLETEAAEAFCTAVEKARPGLRVSRFSCASAMIEPYPDDAFTEGFNKWIASLPKPVAMFSCFLGSPDRFICEELMAARVRVPEDVALIGACDETLICELVRPTLTSVDISFAQVGYAAAELLDGMMRGPASAARPRRVWVRAAGVIERESTDVFAASDELVRRVMRHIQANLGKRLEPGLLAARFNVSRRTLDRRFHDSCGRTVSDVIRHIRFEKARHLLVTTDLLVKEIARSVGLPKPVLLHSLFQQKAGMGPVEYRRIMRHPQV